MMPFECSKCGKCCESQMVPLSESDIDRIVSLGYRLEEFAEFKDGFWRLKEYRGRCIFLDRETRLCKIHASKPATCRLFPVIYFDGKVAVDVETCLEARKVNPEEALDAIPDLVALLYELSSGYIKYLPRAKARTADRVPERSRPACALRTLVV